MELMVGFLFGLIVGIVLMKMIECASLIESNRKYSETTSTKEKHNANK